MLRVLALGLAACGCALDLAHASSGAIGCAPQEIAVSEVAMSWTATSWRARCRDVVFRCAGEGAGEGAPACTPELPLRSAR